MNRLLVCFSAAAMFAAAATAQCLNTTSPGTLIGVGDDTYFAAHYPLGFAFPVAGSVNGTYTHFRVSCNGWIILTDGVNTPAAGAPASYGSIASALGATGGPPRVLAFARDLNLTAANSAGLYYDNTTNPGVSTTITWKNAVDYSNILPTKDIRIELFATGQIQLSYSASCDVAGAASAYVGVSGGQVLVDPGQSDLSAAPVTASNAIYQIFPTSTFDLKNSAITFTPAGSGWVVNTTCQVLPANHTSYGSGCYTISDSIYQSFANAAAASAARSNTAITFTPVGGGGSLVTSGGAFQPVGSVQAVPTIVAVGDDVSQVVPFTVGSFPGSTGLSICSNGFVSAATGNGTGFTPTVSTLLGDPQKSWRSWHDMNPTILGSGQIKYEESAALTMVTWDGVYDYGGTTAADANTIQMQFYPSGVVTVVWGTLSTLGASGTGYLVGYSPGGASTDGGSVDLATVLPQVVSGTNLSPMVLSASPAPVSTPALGTLVTYTQSNIPEAVPTSGVYFGITILSVGQNLPGTDLGFLGMPGCNLHVASLDATLSFVGATNSQTTQFQIPAGVPYGFQLFAQSAAIIAPNSLPNGQNAFGATLSNALASFISTL